MTVEDYVDVCPHCRAGRPASQRIDTKEWVHDWKHGSVQFHTMCLASELRNEQMKETK